MGAMARQVEVGLVGQKHLHRDAYSEERGATLVESAIVLPVFLLIVLAGVELLILAYTALTAEFAVGTALRKAVVGPHNFAGGAYVGTGTPYENFIRSEIIDFCANLGVTIDADNIEVACMAADGCLDTAGVPGAFVRVVVEHQHPILFFDPIIIKSMSIGRNEFWRS